MIVVKDEPLKLVANFLIQNGMFDAKGGRFSGLLVAYQNALVSSLDTVRTSFVMIPNKGIAILIVGRTDKPQLNLYTHHSLRGQGIARDLVTEFLVNIGKDKLDNIECTELVDHIVEQAKVLADMLQPLPLEVYNSDEVSDRE